MIKKVFVTRKIPVNGVEILRGAGFEVEMSDKDRILTKSEIIKKIKKGKFTAVLSLLTDKIDAEVFDNCPDLKIVSNYAVGFNNVDIEEAKKRGIAVTNTPFTSSEPVAEHTVALILSLAKRIVESDKFMRGGKYVGWDPELFMGFDIEGMTVGIVGAGAIGEKVAQKMFGGFNAKIIYYDVKRNENLEKMTRADYFPNVEEVFKRADIISLHVPLLDSTRHLVNAMRIEMMKDGVYIINTSRGPVVDEEALVKYLKNGKIRGAGIDVYENEPKMAKDLAKLNNVILTPHTASATVQNRVQMSRMAAENIIEFFEGKRPKFSVV